MVQPVCDHCRRRLDAAEFKYGSCRLQLGRHSEALNLLVHNMQDYEAADEYCLHHSNSSNSDTDGSGENLYLSLLKLYMQLDSARSEDGYGTTRRRE